MNKRVQYYLILGLAALIYTIISCIGVLAFFGTVDFSVRLNAGLTVAGVNFIVFSLFLFFMRGFANYFSIDYASLQNDEENYTKKLEEFGHLPLKSFIVFIIIGCLFQFITSMLLANYFKFDLFLVAVTSVLNVAIIFLIASYAYVFLDWRTLVILLQNKLTHYPAKLKENRQFRKNIIIPFFMSVMAFIGTFALTVLCLTTVQNSGEMNSLQLLGAAFMKVLPFTLVYHFVVLLLVLMWANNTSLLYKEILHRLEDIASGEKDLTGRVYVASIDEIASMEGCINRFSKTLAGSFSSVKQVVDSLSGIQKQLFSSIELSSKDTQSISEKIDAILELIKHQDNTVREALSAGKGLATNIAVVTDKIKEQNNKISGSVAETQEAIQAVSATAKDSMTVRAKTEELVKAFESGGINIRSTLESVRLIAELSKKLTEINSIIARIASQTNLLAMNAAIEAAHAGSAGMGFSVVADEIRSLAETTAKHTKDSRTSLSAVITEINRAVSLSETTEVSYKDMKDILAIVGETTISISDNMAAQDQTNKSILNGLEETKRITDDTKATVISLSTDSKLLLQALDGLSSESLKTLEHANLTRERNEAVKKSIQLLDNLSMEAMDLTAKADGLVNEFKV